MAASFSLPLSPGVTFGGNRLVSFPDALQGSVLVPSTTGLMSAKSDGRLLVIGPRPPGAARAPMAILVTTGRLQGVRAAKALDAWELDIRAGVPVPVPLGAWAVAKPGKVGVWEGETITFIDCGAGGGSIGDFILGHENQNLRIVGFEPNSSFDNEWIQLRKNFPQHDIHVEKKAVWVANVQKEYLKFDQWCGNNILGMVKSNVRDRIMVDCVDFDEWSKRNVSGFSILKMDIEGAEFPVLEKMMETGSLLLFSECWVEFHDRYDQNNLKPRKEKIMKYFAENGIKFKMLF